MSVLVNWLQEREQFEQSRKTSEVRSHIVKYMEFTATVLLVAAVYMHYDKLIIVTKSVMIQLMTRL